MRMLESIPALPVRDLRRSLPFYRDQLGFGVIHTDTGFASLRRDSAEVHLWVANDERWRGRPGDRPIVSGAESFIAGTASCRIGVDGIDELHALIEPRGILHPNAPITNQPWGDREFGVSDPDGNLVTFFQRD